MTGPGAHLRRLDCLNLKTLSHANCYSLQMVYTNERPHVKNGWSVIRRAQLRPSDKSNEVAGGPSYGMFLKVDFSHGAIHFKIYMFCATFKLIIVRRYQ